MEPRTRQEKLTVVNLKGIKDHSRRDFLKIIGIGGVSIVAFGWLVKSVAASESSYYSLVVVDFNKCTGCRTCEAVCAQFNHRVKVNGEELLGLGNPHLTNIFVYSFNPPVSVPNICVMCGDAPCVAICPVEPDPVTGRKALYRDEKTKAIKCDVERCIGCGACAQVCAEKRVGVIVLNLLTNKPQRMCSLCEGDPACVKYCPFSALTHVKVGARFDGRHYALAPREIAQELTSLWYF
jgi:Fe-S-cluster-containing hydrogenase component 2